LDQENQYYLLHLEDLEDLLDQEHL